VNGVRAPAAKIFTRDALVAWRRAQPGRVVFTNGVFDLLHPGHIDVLRLARAEGEVLVVGVNSDASVRRLGKGPERPIRPEADRAYVLAGLESVDAVCVFDEDTPLALVTALVPDVIVKGGDYSPETIVGADVVQAAGGRVVVIPLVPGQSTTGIVRKLSASSDAS
jgi:D-beta-D-heptose 7-phosphate kinase/D-beta-D-heptose 1-phosphate adenosyltransferase